MNRYLAMIFFSLTVFAGCQENAHTGFESEGAVYFQLSPNSGGGIRDSITYSFIGNPEQEAQIILRVMLMGDASLQARTFKIAVDSEQTTAIEGVHYRAPESVFTLEAGSFYSDIAITLLKADDLDQQTRTLTLTLQAGETLSLGISDRTRARIVFSNIITKPSYWDDYFLDYFFGAWSQVKQQKCAEVLGLVFAEEWIYDFSYIQNAGKLLNYWFEENYPTYDENGNPIEPWF